MRSPLFPLHFLEPWEVCLFVDTRVALLLLIGTVVLIVVSLWFIFHRKRGKQLPVPTTQKKQAYGSSVRDAYTLDDQHQREPAPDVLPAHALEKQERVYLRHPSSCLLDALSSVTSTTTWNYHLVLGWQQRHKAAHCIALPLVGGVYHTLISGQSRSGKDNLALNALLGLVLKQPPDRVQLCIIDGKGLDFAGFEGKAHTWHLALEPETIAQAMHALTQERQRRGNLLRGAKVSKWENYRRSPTLPLLVVYVSELSLLEGAVGKNHLTDWLNQELAAGAAFGIRYIIATQTVSNFNTRWRSQISLYLAAFQPSQSQDQPNTGLTTSEIRAAGGIPPSELPAPPAGAGVFTCVLGREVKVIRAGLMDDEQRYRLLAELPESNDPGQVQECLSKQPPTITDACIEAETDGASTAWTERHELIAYWLAQGVTGGRQLARKVFPGTDGGGSYYTQTMKVVAEVKQMLPGDAHVEEKPDEDAIPDTKASEQCNTITEGHTCP
jgi:hypothetical protein